MTNQPYIYRAVGMELIIVWFKTKISNLNHFAWKLSRAVGGITSGREIEGKFGIFDENSVRLIDIATCELR